MSQARSFTIELTQAGTGKKATVKVNQAGFIPEYTFEWDGISSTTTHVYATADGILSNPLDLKSWKTTLKSSTSTTYVHFTAKANDDQIIEDLSTNPFGFKLKPNPTYSTRSVTITLTQNESGKTLTLKITQQAKADDGVFKADPTALSFEAASGTKSSKITSTSKGQTVGWTITNKSSMPSWLTISGEGTGTLLANVKDNA